MPFTRSLLPLRWSGVLVVFTSLAIGCAQAATPDARLAEAAKRNDVSAVKSLLLAHVPVNAPEGDGSTALHWAVYGDNLPLAKLLLDAHADANATTRLGAITPLLMACQNGNAAMISLLLAKGAQPNLPNDLGTTPLMIAAASGNSDAVKVLLDHGANPNAREHAHDQTALMFAANLNRADAIKLLIARGADPNASSKIAPVARISFGKDGTMPMIDPPEKEGEKEAEDKKPTGKEKELAEAVERGETKTFDHGNNTVGMKEAAGKGGERPKTVAAADAGIATPTIEKKKEREYGAKKMGGMTPLLYAARQGNIQAATALLDNGAKIDQVSGSELSTPLVMAIANGHFDVAKLLVDRGANVNLANAMGLAPLYATIDVQYAPHEWSAEPIVDQEHTNYLALMRLLLAHGADVNARLGKKVWSRVLTQDMGWVDPTGSTAFWRATQAEDLVAMRLLKDAGADPNLPTKAGVTPLMVAAGLGWGANYSNTVPGPWLPVVKYCVEQGANLNAVDDLGYSAMHGAAFIGDDPMVHYLVSAGANVGVKTKAGDSPADMANGPFAHSIPHLETVALLESLGSSNAHNCRSDQCVVAPKEEKKTAEASPKPDIAKPGAHDKKPASMQ